MAADLALDAVEFSIKRLGFEPDDVQKRVLLGGPRGILNCARQWGKSTLLAVKAVHHAYTKAESLTLILGPSGRQSAETVKKAAAFARKLGLRAKGDGSNRASIAFPNGSRIVGLPSNEATIRGFSKVSLLIVDEASRVKDELFDAARPMQATCEGELWLLSTPCGQRGFFWELWRSGEGWERIQVTGPECARYSATFLADKEKEKGTRRYRQDYLCEFVDDEGAVFLQESIGRAFREGGAFGPVA